MSKKAITLLIEAHGEEDLDIAVNVPRVELLSFSGKTGELGDFGIVDDQSLELHILDFLRNLYLNKSTAANQAKVYQNNDLTTGLRTLYEEDAGKGYSNGGFVRTKPIRQRTFYFSPNKHEDCRRCRKADKYIKYKDGTKEPNPEYAKVCLPNRKLAANLCPVYGLVVVTSSDKTDKPFTLESAVGTGVGPLSISNLHMNSGAQRHWFQKIDQARFPQASIAFQHMIQNRNISLTQLSKIFEAMGYTDIYVLDPSCRDTTKLGTVSEPIPLQAAVYSVMEQKRGRGVASISDAVTYARPLPSRAEPNPKVIDETTDMEIDNGNGPQTKVDSQGRTWSCDINGACVLIGAATGALASRAGFPANYAAATGLAAATLARGAAYKALGRGGRKSKKQGKNKNKNKNNKSKKRNKNKTRKHK
jgi:hypothetical protein